MSRLLVWRGTDEWLAEAARVELSGQGMSAKGTQLGAEPVPYRLDYELETAGGFVTRSLRAETSGEGWARRVHLDHDGEGNWRFDARQEGEAPFSEPGGDAEALRGSLDCDLAFSPLTNMMPIRRHSLHRKGGEADFVMAWLSVPDLGFHASPQRYEHVRRNGEESVVRFVSLDSAFRAELELDEDGLVINYPQLARRVTGGMSA